MLNRLAAAMSACIALSMISNTDVLGCQLPSVQPRIVPADPDAAVVFEGIVETREDAVENGKITGDLWHTNIVRVLKGDKAIRQVTQFINNGSCWTWRPTIGGRGFLLGTMTPSPEGRWYFSGEWFSPAESTAFSWIRFGEYRGPSPYIAPQPESRKPFDDRFTVPARPGLVNQGCGGNGLGGAC